jgi:hypothetical protein
MTQNDDLMLKLMSLRGCIFNSFEQDRDIPFPDSCLQSIYVHRMYIMHFRRKLRVTGTPSLHRQKKTVSCASLVHCVIDVCVRESNGVIY